MISGKKSCLGDVGSLHVAEHDDGQGVGESGMLAYVVVMPEPL